MKDNDKKECIVLPNDKKTQEISNKMIYFIYVLFFLTGVVISMSNGTFSTLMSRIKKELDIESDSLIGFVSSIYFLGQVLGNFKYQYI